MSKEIILGGGKVFFERIILKWVVIKSTSDLFFQIILGGYLVLLLMVARIFIYIYINGVRVSSRISGGPTPLRRTDFLARNFFDFDERLLLSTPSFSTKQLLETSESRDPDFLGSLSAQNPGA